MNSSSSSSAYSSLFTAGLFSLSTSRVDPSNGPGPLPPIITTAQAAWMPSISIQAPSSPPRRRRKSSATIGSSPMAAIKSPAQRAQFSQRTAQRNYGILVTSPSRALTFPTHGNSVYTVPENRSMTRNRRGRPLPPTQKPAPSTPLPALPFTESNNQRNPLLRRDSDTLPLPSPTFLASLTRQPTTPTNQLIDQTTFLAPSPMDLLGGRLSPSSAGGMSLLGAFDENEEHGQNVTTLGE